MKKTLLSYNEYNGLEQTFTYEIWCGLLDSIETGLLSEDLKDIFKKSGSIAKESLMRIFGPIKDEIIKLVDTLKVDLKDIINALKEKSVFGFLKAIGFKVKLLINMMNEVAKLVRNGLLRVCKEIFRNKYIQKIQSGVMEIDELLDKYPILKKISGVAIAGILFYIWLNMSFIGDIEYDMNISSITAALKGSYSLEELFASPEGMLMMSLFALGGFVSFPWLAASVPNILLAMTYTGYVKLKTKYPNTLEKIRNHLKIR